VFVYPDMDLYLSIINLLFISKPIEKEIRL
jgi:hypothetical protein